jgi:hypothetical protein
MKKFLEKKFWGKESFFTQNASRFRAGRAFYRNLNVKTYAS